MTTQSTIEIVPLALEHRQTVIDLIMSSFFTQEPLNASLKFDLPHEPLSWIEHIFDQALHHQCSFVAIDTTTTPQQNIVGVILNGISNRTDPADTFKISSEKLNFIFTLIDQISNAQDLYDLYKTDRIFHCDIINIDQNQRGQNLSARLISASLEQARKLGITAGSVVCTSLFSRKAFLRQDFKVIKEILYSDYGKGRLTDMGVHDRCTLLARAL